MVEVESLPADTPKNRAPPGRKPNDDPPAQLPGRHQGRGYRWWRCQRRQPNDQLVGTCGVGKASVRVFDDYAHHPTEISATLAAARMVLEQGDGGRCMVVFQPHLYSRTKAFAAEFGRALNAADEVFVLDVYGAREQPLAGVSGASVAEHVTVPMRYVPDFSAVAQQVAAAASPGDVIVTMGAGDVTLLGPEILTALRVRANRSAPGRPGVLG